MKSKACCHMLGIAGLLVLLLAGVGHAEPAVTQSVILYPGWNAIFLEVQPEPRTPPAVFQGIPVESVWTWQDRDSPVEFIQDPAEGLWGKAGWSVYYKSAQEAFLSNLFAIQANHAYLVKLGGKQPVTWSVTGKPLLPQVRWTPDSFNLVGFPVDPGAPPTFAAFFSPSAAHADQPAYRLNTAGEWVRVVNPAAETMRRGEAYWVFCRGGSDYTGPLQVESTRAEGLAFGETVTEQSITIRNQTNSARSIAVRPAETGPAPLAYRSPDPTATNQWPALPAQFLAGAGSRVFLRLAVKRAEFRAVDYGTVIEISDRAGTLIRLPLTASAPPHNSLWVGTVTVNRVGEVNRDPSPPTATGSEFQFRLILHVNGSREARILKEVIQLWENGTTRPDPRNSGVGTVDRPGRYVLVTRDDLVPKFSGAALRDGEAVGRRVSSAAFDFSGDALPLAGSFGSGNILTGTISLPADFPTNPYRHRYHPDHGSGYDITRRIELEFTATDPDGLNPPGWGYSVAGGIYRETVTGLHKREITAQGTFRIGLASFIDTLNPEPGQ